MELRKHVRPADVITFDCLVSNGIAQFEVTLILQSLKDQWVTWDQLRQFVSSDWTVSSALGSRKGLIACLAAAREKARRHLQGCSFGDAYVLASAAALLAQSHRGAHADD